MLLFLWVFAAGHLAAQTLLLSVTNDADQVVLSWPASVADVILEQSVLTEPSVWSPVSPALYESDATNFSFRPAPADGGGVFRLRRVSGIPALSGSWALDGNGGLSADQSIGASAVITTNTTWATGRFGAGSLQFNGLPLNTGGSVAWIANRNYGVLPSNGLPFSLSLWFSPDSFNAGSRTIVGIGDGNKSGWRVDMNTTGPGTNFLTLTAAGSGGSTISGRTLLLPGQWQLLTIAGDTNKASLYLNGSLLGEGSLSLVNTDGPLYVGAIPGGPGTFHGRIDEIRAYTNAFIPEDWSLTGKWNFDDGSGGVVTDSSPNGQLASVTATNGWVAGKSGTAIDLALASVVIPNEQFRVLPASGGAFSVSAWVQPRDLPTGLNGLFSSGEGTNSGWDLTIDVESTGSWIEFSSTRHGGTLALRAPVALTNGAWAKVDITYDGGIASLFVNGTRLASDSGAIRGSEAPLVIGAVRDATNFSGLIDELKIYSHARSDSEIGPVALPMWEMALANSSTNLTLRGSGPAGKPLSYKILSSPGTSRGTIEFSPDSGTITYKAGAQKGPDQFVYTVSDGEFTSPPATGSVSVVQPHWISPNGGTQQPLDGSSPDHAMPPGPSNSLDQIWKTNNYYDCFFYAPGEYQTTGSRYLQRSSANTGCKHIGSGTEGPGATIIRLVDNWSAWEEGTIFGANGRADDFEVHNLVLDCNARNNPKYTVGEPVTLRVPLTATSLVDRVTLRWSDLAAGFGPPDQFKVGSRIATADGSVTNWLDQTGTGGTNEVTVSAMTDELQIQLTRRANGVEFYTLKELEISGAAVSLPTATLPDGTASRLDTEHSIVFAADQDAGSSWASGPEDQVQITLPLERDAVVSQMDLQWNCHILPDLRRLGPASQFVIAARDPKTLQWRDVPFTTVPRVASGSQIVTFAQAEPADQLMLVLTAREAGVDSYSLKEVKLQNSGIPVAMRVPVASTSLAPYSIMRAFDGDLQLRGWASGSQGSVSGIDVAGSNLKFTGLKVIGFGTKAMRECFPLAVFNGPVSADNPPLRNILVEDCLFTEPATNNTDGISVVSVAGNGAGSVINGIIRRCTVTGIGPFFDYSHAFVGSRVENCFAEDIQVGVYFEPTPNHGEGHDSIGPVLIRSNVFLNVVRGVSVDFHAKAHFESLVCIGNEIVLSGDEFRGWGIGACDTCQEGIPGTITNLTALNNIIRYPGWKARPGAAEQGIVYSDIQHAVFANNVIALGTDSPLRVRGYPSGGIPPETPPEDCDHPGLVQPGPPAIPPSLDNLLPGYRRAWYNNRDLSGALLTVRYNFWGTDSPASQQQWRQ